MNTTFAKLLSGALYAVSIVLFCLAILQGLSGSGIGIAAIYLGCSVVAAWMGAILSTLVKILVK